MLDFLKHRSKEEEIMDDFNCDGTVVDQTLKELHLINTYLGGNKISTDGILELIKNKTQSQYSIVDLGCGGGDTLSLLAQLGKRKQLDLRLTGIDANPYIVDYAIQNTNSKFAFQAINIFSEDFKKQRFDIAHCSLFLHHFDEEQIVTLLKQLKQQCNIGIMINDLHRHPISYYFTKWLLTAWSKSEMVKYDSVLSVAKSFTRKELKQYLAQAGITNYRLKWR
ncbi:MAG: methyltransferase domain-containing protein, partial [Reichenbachiella sp.]